MERFGFTSNIRSNNKLIWLHAASVGESLAMLTLVRSIAEYDPTCHFLLTTGTVTSASMVTKALPINSIHQFLPIDEYFCVRRFFKSWKPSFGIILESEIWPNLIDLGSKCCPLILANATMSDSTVTQWKKYPKVAKFLLSKFAAILCQNDVIAAKYNTLIQGNVRVCGNIKFSSKQLFVDTNLLAQLKDTVGMRPVIVAASTHPGDEEIIIAMHKALHPQHPSLLTVIVPRHVTRMQEICKILDGRNVEYNVRSKGESPNADIYIADTMGELGLFFSIANITIICGSFKNGGHNIIEPAFFDTKIVFGPDMRNSRDIADEFLLHKAAVQIQNKKELIIAIQHILLGQSFATSGAHYTDTDLRAMSDNAKMLIEKHKNVISNYMQVIKQYIQ